MSTRNSGRRGFASMDPEERRRMARRGGQASHGGYGNRYEENYDQDYDEEEDDDYGGRGRRQDDDDYEDRGRYRQGRRSEGSRGNYQGGRGSYDDERGRRSSGGG